MPWHVATSARYDTTCRGMKLRLLATTLHAVTCSYVCSLRHYMPWHVATSARYDTTCRDMKLRPAHYDTTCRGMKLRPAHYDTTCRGMKLRLLTTTLHAVTCSYVCSLRHYMPWHEATSAHYDTTCRDM